MLSARQIQPSHQILPSITEIVLPSFSSGSLTTVLPMLAELSKSNKDKWLTWVAPKNITKAMLEQYGFRCDNVRLIYTDNDIIRQFVDGFYFGCEADDPINAWAFKKFLWPSSTRSSCNPGERASR